MSLPPNTVQIKRKRTDAPVDILEIQDGNDRKRLKNAGDYVFAREVPKAGSGSPTPVQHLLPRPIKASRAASSQLQPGPRTIGPQISLSKPQDPATKPALKASLLSSTTVPPRRFHISRSKAHSWDRPIGIKKRVIFTERKPRPLSFEGGIPSDPDKPASVKQSGKSSTGPIGYTPSPTESLGSPSDSAVKPHMPPARLQNLTKSSSAAPLRNVQLPSGKTVPWDVDSEDLVAAMQAYTLQEIGKSLAETKAMDKVSTPIRKRPQGKFARMPKCVPRYAERHPEAMAETANAITEKVDTGDEPEDEEMGDDSDYIIDTYIRIPADAVEAKGADRNVGFLVLNSQPDIDEFYAADSDSEEEDFYEDEDENAEGHYTADYPDEEVESDDEFNRNPYHYRNNDSDDEFDDGAFNDDEARDTLWTSNNPWAIRPAGNILDDDGDQE